MVDEGHDAVNRPCEGASAEQPIGVRDGVLRIEDCDAEELAHRFGTPLYVISEARLRGNARRWSAAIAAAWPGPTELLPSLKANTSLTLRRILNDEGLGCDVFGHNELTLALRAGVPPAMISLNGASKPDALLELAVARGVRITLDSLDEVRRADAIACRLGRLAAVRLRLRPWLAASRAASDFEDGYPAHLAVQDYRAGMPQAEALEGLALAQRSTALDPCGVMVHVGRQTTDLAFWTALGDQMATLIDELRTASPRWRPREIDLGGGFAVPRDPAARALAHRRDAPEAPAPEAYLQALVAPLAAALRRDGLDPAGICLQAEPGRAIYGDAGAHLTTVRHVKEQAAPVPRAWIETDTSEAFLADTNIEHNAWTIVAARAGGEGGSIDAAVTGASCGWDVLAPAATRQRPTPGDVLAFLDTGAYQDACASNFNAMARPATVLVSGSDARVIRRAETLNDLLSRDVAAPARP